MFEFCFGWLVDTRTMVVPVKFLFKKVHGSQIYWGFPLMQFFTNSLTLKKTDCGTFKERIGWQISGDGNKIKWQFQTWKSHSFWTIFCKIGHSVLAQLARIDDDDEYERSPVNNNSQFELARSHTDSDLELEFSFKNFEIRKYRKFVLM